MAKHVSRLVVAVTFAASLCAFGEQDPRARFIVERENGELESIPVTTSGAPGEIIVEFHQPPLVLAASGKRAVTAESQRASFAQFRSDLGVILRADASGKSAAGTGIRWEYFRAFHGASLRVPPHAVAAIARLPYVKQIHANREVRALAGASVSQIRADKVWSDLHTRGEGIVVAVIDTGIDYRHPALGGGIGPGFKVIGGYDFVNDDADPLDDNVHGTHVAGIIAGESAEMTGVAPGASLIAYKVLGASGGGTFADVLAAVERSLDPNLDGNISDHVDVANLSLGGSGYADDAVSRAIDNATLGGIVFCIGAGNRGGYHRISSPGTSRAAITVGAVDSQDSIAGFSSRGPSAGDLAIKPEVVAPGVEIFSAALNGKYETYSGTSMATPHVAGVCALLIALHPDWTPAQIKAALMTRASATSIDAMAVGSGRIDAYASATSALTAEPPSLSFGLNAAGDSTWSGTRSFLITNRGGESVTFSLTSGQPVGVTANVTPSSVTLQPGGSATVTLSLTARNAEIPRAPPSFSVSDAVTLKADDEVVSRISWSFARAIRATVDWSGEFAFVMLYDAQYTRTFQAAATSDHTSEFLLGVPGPHNTVVFGWSVDPETNAMTQAALIHREQLPIDGDALFSMSDAEAPHRITLTSRDEQNVPFDSGPDRFHTVVARLRLDQGLYRSLLIPPFASHELRVNSLAEHVTLETHEALFDLQARSFYAVNHRPLRGVSADATLEGGGADLRSANLRLLLPANGDQKTQVTYQFPSRSSEPLALLRMDVPTPERVWNTRVFLSSDEPQADTAGFSFLGEGGLNTPQIRIRAGEMTVDARRPLLPFSGDTFVFGGGPMFPLMRYFAPQKGLSIDALGPMADHRPNEVGQTTVSLFDANGGLLERYDRSAVQFQRELKGPHTIEAVYAGTLFPGLPATMALTMTLDGNRADSEPPTLNALMLIDDTGPIDRVSPHGNATLVFSAIGRTDTTVSPNVYHSVLLDAISVSYRYAGTAQWHPLNVAELPPDPRVPDNVRFGVDLSSVAAIDRALVDVKFDLADDSGNRSTIVLEPAFAVGAEFPPKRRSVGSLQAGDSELE